MGPFLQTAKLHGNKLKILDPSNNTSEIASRRSALPSFLLLFFFFFRVLGGWVGHGAMTSTTIFQ